MATTVKEKRLFILDELKRLGVTHSEIGVSIEKLNYDDIQYEYVLASFREIDIEVAEGKWF